MNENRIIIIESENICRIYFKDEKYASVTIYFDKIEKHLHANSVWLLDVKGELITIIDADKITYEK